MIYSSRLFQTQNQILVLIWEPCFYISLAGALKWHHAGNCILLFVLRCKMLLSEEHGFINSLKLNDSPFMQLIQQVT